jgi:hypothetical protein
VSGYERRFGQSTPKYMVTGERQSVGFPVDSGFARTTKGKTIYLHYSNPATLPPISVTGRVSIENDMLK